MESDEKVDLIQTAIRKLMDDEETDDKENDDDAGGGGRRHNRRRLLSTLLSELESPEHHTPESEAETAPAPAPPSPPHEMTKLPPKEDGSSGNEEILKELNNIKRQNTITHHLLTGLILITLAWQFSEVSLILRIKDGLTNPLKSFGQTFKGLFKNRHENVQDVIKHASEMQRQVVEPTYLPGLKIPELPHLDWPGFESSDGEDG